MALDLSHLSPEERAALDALEPEDFDALDAAPAEPLDRYADGSLAPLLAPEPDALPSPAEAVAALAASGWRWLPSSEAAAATGSSSRSLLAWSLDPFGPAPVPFHASALVRGQVPVRLLLPAVAPDLAARGLTAADPVGSVLAPAVRDVTVEAAQNLARIGEPAGTGPYAEALRRALLDGSLLRDPREAAHLVRSASRYGRTVRDLRLHEATQGTSGLDLLEASSVLLRTASGLSSSVVSIIREALPPLLPNASPAHADPIADAVAWMRAALEPGWLLESDLWRRYRDAGQPGGLDAGTGPASLLAAARHLDPGAWRKRGRRGLLVPEVTA